MPARNAPASSLSVEDLSLPRTMVQRLAKGVLPPNTQIQKDALLAISKSATVFVNYVSQRANENAIGANKKTIQPKDVLDAIQDLEFPEFNERLEAELQKFTTTQNDKRNSYRRKVREQQIAAKASAASEHLASGPNSSPNSKSGANTIDGEPAAKKAKMEAGEEDDDEDIEDMDETMEGDDMDDPEDEGEDEDVEDEEEVEESADELAEDALETREVEEVDDALDEDSD